MIRSLARWVLRDELAALHAEHARRVSVYVAALREIAGCNGGNGYMPIIAKNALRGIAPDVTKRREFSRKTEVS